MDLLELMKCRRSIRKYQQRQVELADLQKVMEAGAYAPNAGGGQRSILLAIRNPALVETVGQLNLRRFDRTRLAGSYVSREQPSNIDDPSIKSGFYGAPTVVAVFSQKNFLYGVPDAFCCAENMVLEATALGLASCIVARGEETFDNDEGRALLQAWGIPENYIARCFVLLGYCDGKYPQGKPRRADRLKIVE
ncbi:MAG TPA: nitroreductase family protein [Candidatus Pullichristensenella stercorigallinarum]|uniref:Nitroreductase family protein n=1 Tax=Candidatus Pullichristensenella stercorigallinarum TaxID=2840909 RepID=A0A9D0ZL58_9FIRM|nr:nitroreductase family protein [Candidatus Pullichristensenella stercorigallinarum]